VISYYYTRTN